MKETLTGGCGALYGSQRCHATTPLFATAAEVEAATARSATAPAAGTTARGTSRDVSPASRPGPASTIATPTTSAPDGPRSVAGQPAPTRRSTDATSARRAATAHEIATTKAKIAARTAPRISTWTRGSNGVRTS